MANKSTSKQNLSNNNFMIVALLITLVVLGATVLIGKGLVTTIIRDTKVISKKNAANTQLAKNLDAAPKLVDAYQQLNGAQRLIADALPNTSDFPGLIAQIENMAGVSGVTLKSVVPDALTGVATTQVVGDIPLPQEYKYSVTMSGSYDALQKFLTAVETSVRPMKVSTIQISGSGSALTFSIDMTTNYQDIATIPYKLEVVK